MRQATLKWGFSMPVEYQHLVWEIEKGFEAFWTNLVAFSDLVREVKKQRR